MELTLSLLVLFIVLGAFAGGITFGIRKQKLRKEINEVAEARWASEIKMRDNRIASLEHELNKHRMM